MISSAGVALLSKDIFFFVKILNRMLGASVVKFVSEQNEKS